MVAGRPHKENGHDMLRTVVKDKGADFRAAAAIVAARPDTPEEVRQREEAEIVAEVDRCVRRFARRQCRWAQLRDRSNSQLERCIE